MNALFNDPHGVRHARICNIYGLGPEYNAKEAGEAPRNVMDWCARPEVTQYPLDTPERTVVSWCHANEDRTLPDDVRTRVLASVKKAADWWGVELPVAREETSPAKHTFKVATEAGEDVYVIHDARDALHFAELICKNAADYSYDTRRQVAQALLSAPADIKACYPPDTRSDLELAAGDQLASAADVKIACDIRAGYLEALEKPEMGADLRELGNLAKGAFVDRDFLVKTASMIDQLDRAMELTVYYADGTLLPAERSFCGIPYSHAKQAAEDMVPLNNGRITSVRAVLANRETVNDFFIKLAGEDVSKDTADVLVQKLQGMDEIQTDAFASLTRLCME